MEVINPLGMPSKEKPVKFGTLAQRVGGGLASIPIVFDILIGTNTVGVRGSKGPCQKKTINFCSPCSSF